MSSAKTVIAQIVAVAVLFVLTNLIVYPFLPKSIPNSTVNALISTYGISKLMTVYPEKSEMEITNILSETWGRVPRYEPFTQFEERETKGTYVNVDKAGFRLSANQVSWPPSAANITVFVFGGSTTFGYGVEDRETTPSRLQEQLRKQVDERLAIYNFGVGAYYSTLELMLFEKLLLDGHVPDVAIFIDGLNDFHYAEPQFTKEIRCFVYPVARECAVSAKTLAEALQPETRRGIAELPVIRAVRLAVDLITGRPKKSDFAKDAAHTPAAAKDEAMSHDLNITTARLNRYNAARKMIEALGTHYGVRTIFVWQPVPDYKYNQANHIFAVKERIGDENVNYARYGYAMMRDEIARNKPADNFLWCADIQEGVNAPLYLDAVHYTASFSKMVAECVASRIKERNLLGGLNPKKRN